MRLVSSVDQRIRWLLCRTSTNRQSLIWAMHFRENTGQTRDRRSLNLEAVR